MIEKLANLTWARVAIAGLAASAVLYFFAGSDPEALLTRKEAAQQELDKQTKLLKEAKNMASNAVRFEEENRRMEAQFKEMIEFLPIELNATEITRIISEEAVKAGASVMRIGAVSRTDQRGEFYETSKLEFQLQGTYSQLVLFLSYLTRVPRLLTFDRVALVAENNSAGKISLTATLIAYRYVSESKPPNGIPGSKEQNATAEPQPN